MVGVMCCYNWIFCFDPWLLKMSGGTKEIIRVEDFASDAFVLQLASNYTTKKLIFLYYADSGNKAVTVVTLVF